MKTIKKTDVTYQCGICNKIYNVKSIAQRCEIRCKKAAEKLEQQKKCTHEYNLMSYHTYRTGHFYIADRPTNGIARECSKCHHEEKLPLDTANKHQLKKIFNILKGE